MQPHIVPSSPLKLRRPVFAWRDKAYLAYFFSALTITSFHLSLRATKRPSLRSRKLSQRGSTVPASRAHHAPVDSIKLDFFVAGFPKCGTTTLLKTFEAHNETFVPPKEECAFDASFSDDEAHSRLSNAFSSVSDSQVHRGIKCPNGLNTRAAIDRLEDLFPETKLIFGLRHPVYYFQSFFNFRVNMVHQGKLDGPIPLPESLMGSGEWARVSTESARFEKFLTKLGKTTSSEFEPTPFKVFLYTLEQMEDENEQREASFRESLGAFLELKHPIAQMKRANKNNSVGSKAFAETIDICDSRYKDLRRVLVENGRESQRWIREEFLLSPDAVVSNVDHFHELLKQWEHDPCAESESQS